MPTTITIEGVPAGYSCNLFWTNIGCLTSTIVRYLGWRLRSIWWHCRRSRRHQGRPATTDWLPAVFGSKILRSSRPLYSLGRHSGCHQLLSPPSCWRTRSSGTQTCLTQHCLQKAVALVHSRLSNRQIMARSGGLKADMLGMQASISAFKPHVQRELISLTQSLTIAYQRSPNNSALKVICFEFEMYINYKTIEDF